MNIEHAANSDYERYEELLLQRDHLEKEAFGYQLEYTREFGDLTVRAFELKIECISLKKSIAFCIAAKNHGEEPDAEALRAWLEKQLSAYRKQLDDMIAERDASRRGRPLSPFEVSEVKKIYRRIAKMLHPDISPLTEEYPELCELFQRVMVAYQCSDLRELRDLEVMINAVLEKNGIDGFNFAIPDVESRIAELEEEIERILTTEPYTYRDLLSDAFAIQTKKDELTKEIEEYKAYKEQLGKQLREIMGEDDNG